VGGLEPDLDLGLEQRPISISTWTSTSSQATSSEKILAVPIPEWRCRQRPAHSEVLPDLDQVGFR
jgi:hypothetical protein